MRISWQVFASPYVCLDKPFRNRRLMDLMQDVVTFHTAHMTLLWGGGVAQWLGCRISDQGVPGSNPGRCTFRRGLEQVTFMPCLVLVKPRKRWTDD